ncbi:hypothetical protein AO384_0961 [Moraxella catarrhalis]|nr:hypothetical protein AO384_0961 [Moraxella catarrhalis]
MLLKPTKPFQSNKVNGDKYRKKFQLRRERKIRNHVFSSLMAFVYLKQQASLGFSSVYAWVSHLFTPVVAQVSK